MSSKRISVLLLVTISVIFGCLLFTAGAPHQQDTEIIIRNGTPTSPVSATVEPVNNNSEQPTQTPNIIYVVVTATPESADEGIILRNEDETVSREQIINSVVSTMQSSQNTGTAGSDSSSASTSNLQGGCTTGDNCTISFEVVSQTFPNGGKTTKNSYYVQDWILKNTGTCTWTTDWNFVFTGGTISGNNTFPLKKNVAPGEQVDITLWIAGTAPTGGTYYSTYTLQSPDGTRCGDISATYTIFREVDPTATAAPTVPPRRDSPYFPNWFGDERRPPEPPNWQWGPGGWVYRP